MEEPVFDVLRTREQLGYNVYATLRNTFGVLGFSITVDFQADKFRYGTANEVMRCTVWATAVRRAVREGSLIAH